MSEIPYFRIVSILEILIIKSRDQHIFPVKGHTVNILGSEGLYISVTSIQLSCCNVKKP